MERSERRRWLDAYVEAWKSYDREQIAALFSRRRALPVPPVRRARSSGATPSSSPGWGRGITRAPPTRDEPGTYDAAYEPVAVDGDVAVATGTSTYYAEPGGAGRRGLRQLLRDPLRRRGALPRVHRVVREAAGIVECRRMSDEGIFYDDDADLSAARGQDDRDPRLRLAGPRARAQPEGLGLRRRRRPSPGSASRAEAEAEGLTVLDVGDAASRGDVVMILLPDEKQAEVWEREIARRDRPRQPAAVRARLLDPLRPDRAAARGRRGHGRPQGPGPPGAPPVRRGPGRPLPDGRPPGRDRQRPRAGARLREGDRRHPRRGDRDDLQGRDRDRPVRRAGRALRRPHRAGPGGLRDPGRGAATTPGSPTSSACTS